MRSNCLCDTDDDDDIEEDTEDVDVEDDDKDGIPEDGWRSCDVTRGCRDDDTLRVTGELHFTYETDSNYSNYV